MILFETIFGFKDVLQIQPGGYNTVSHELVDQAWHLWATREPAAHAKHYETAYATVEVCSTGYTVTIQKEEA